MVNYARASRNAQIYTRVKLEPQRGFPPQLTVTFLPREMGRVRHQELVQAGSRSGGPGWAEDLAYGSEHRREHGRLVGHGDVLRAQVQA